MSDSDHWNGGDTSKSLQEMIASAFNGPPIIGIGGTTDQGLPAALHHRIPYDPSQYVYYTLDSPNRVTSKDQFTNERYALDSAKLTQAGSHFRSVSSAACRRYSDYNIEKVLNIKRVAADTGVSDPELISRVRRDVQTILSMMLCYNLYAGECVKNYKDVKDHRDELTQSDWEATISADQVNRGLTFLAARAHTKYQTNHSMGGDEAQGAVASCIRAYYSLSSPRGAKEEDRRRYQFVYKCLYWAMHPVNEPLLLCQILERHSLNEIKVHAFASPPEIFQLAEYMTIRGTITAATTHVFSVGAQAALRLRDFNLLAYLPNPSRLVTLARGFKQAQFYGAACHPAARHWGVNKVSLSQRSVQDVVADLMYAIKQLFPADTLAASPLARDDSNVNVTWKTFIDGLKAKIDESVKEMVSPETMKDVLPSLTPGTKEYAPKVLDVLLLKNAAEIIRGDGKDWTDEIVKEIQGF